MFALSSIARFDFATNVSGAVRGAIIDEQEQTTSNLAMVTAAIQRSAALISETTVIPNTVSLLLVCSNRRCVTWSNRSVSLSLSDSAELDQHFGGTATVECRCAANKLLKVSMYRSRLDVY